MGLMGGRAGQRTALTFIFITLLIDIMAFGMIIPILPRLILGFVGGDATRTAIWYGWFQVIYLTAQFLFTPVQGALSDRFGRRPVILLSSMGLGLDFLFMAVAKTLPLLLFGRLIAGVAASSFPSASAYIADVTPPEERPHAFAMISMTFGTGLIIAPILGAALGSIDTRLPFWTAFFMSMGNLCYGLLVLPESLPPERRSPEFRLAHANPFGALRLLGRYRQVLGLLGIVALDALVHMVSPTTFILYAYYRFEWGPSMVGITLALIGVLQIVQGWLVRRIVRKLGERHALVFGLVCGTLGLALQAVAPTGYTFWLAMPVVALWGVAQPALQTLMSGLVHPSEQGRLQGAVTSVSSLFGLIGCIVFPATLTAVIASQRHDIWAGATFFLASGLLAIALLAACLIIARIPAHTGRAAVRDETLRDFQASSTSENVRSGMSS
jgi:Arabinose efflux permease